MFQLLSLRIEDDPQLTKWLKQKNYLSQYITNEIITLLGNDLLREILRNICEAAWFSIQADKTTDISNHEQLSMSIRWVSKTWEIHEDFIGLVHVPNITSPMLTSAIKDVLIRCFTSNTV